MADEADDAGKMEELHTSLKIKEVRDAASRREFEPKGRCYNCDAIFDGEDAAEKLACDEFCLEDWQKRLKLQARR